MSDYSELQEIFNGNAENQQLLAESMLGEDVEEFCKSDIGRYLIGRATIEAQDAAATLKTTFPWRRRRIQQLQNEIWRAESFKIWLLQQIRAGRTALAALENRTGEIEE